jgi:LytR cell envelope-related transcriptional attenuator
MWIHERADEEDTERKDAMEGARILEPVSNGDESPLARARVHRQLTVDEAARRAELSPEEVQWLEEGRLYRFPTADRAILATVLYASALGIEHREALELAGLPVPPLPFQANPWRRFGAITAFAALILAAVLAIAFARNESKKPQRAGAAASAAAAASLPAPWAIKVVVLNGSGDYVYTRTVASHVQAMGYRITHVGRATSFNYPQTQVYFPPGGEAIAVRLAKALDVPVQPLPGGTDPRRLVVIVGPETVGG